MIPDYYGLLGIPHTADDRAIRDAYRALAKRHHPDLAQMNSVGASERFSRITAAYNVLRNAATRAQYDRERAQERQSTNLRQQQLRENLRKARDITRRPGSPSWEMPMHRPRRRDSWRDRAPQHATAKRTVVRGWWRLAMLAPAVFIAVLSMEGVNWSYPSGNAPALTEPVIAAGIHQVSTRSESVNGRVRRVSCTAEDGTPFSLSHGTGLAEVSVNGSRLTQLASQMQGDLVFLSGMTGSGRKVAIGLFIGDKNGTTFTPYDAAGNPGTTMGATCSDALTR